MSYLPARTRYCSGSVSVQAQNQQNPTVTGCGREALSRASGGLVLAVVLLFATGWGGVVAGAQTLLPGWKPFSGGSAPTTRFGAPLAYDAAHAQVVMFGGFSTSGDVNETWLWNGSTWAQANPATSPTPRDGAAMAYDAAHGRVVLFGGQVGGASNWTNETWLWDGTTWANATPANPPPARNVTAMAYDPVHGNVVMFGGSVSGQRGGDTWIWDGASWTQRTPANSPPPRDDYAMVYDAANNQIVIFGGEDSNLNLLNDTWVWDGTNWTQKTVASPPSARRGEGMAYDAALGKVVMFGGVGGGGYFNDTWTWDGTNWALQSTTNAPAGREVLNGFAYDTAQAQVVMFGGYNGNQLGDTSTFGVPQNFGSANVCPPAGSAVGSCSNALTLTYEFPTVNIGAIQVLTQGAPNLDFTSPNSNACIGSFQSGATCTFSVTLAPKAPGLRVGSVNIYDSSTPAHLLSSTPIYGNGIAPQIAFGPGAQTTVGNGIASPYSFAEDAAGNIYIPTWTDGHVVKIAAGGGTQTNILSSPGSTFEGIAVDGAGNVYTADQANNVVVEIPAGAGQPIALGTGLSAPSGVAVDGSGNVFVADYHNNRVVKIPAGGGPQTTVGTGLNQPQGVAVDALGDVFIADTGNNQIVEVMANGVQTTLQFAGLSNPIGVAVDAAGDVFAVDYYGGPVYELTPAGVQTAVSVTGLGPYLVSVGLDAAGNIFIPDISNNQVVELTRSVPALNLGLVSSGYQSTDTPLTIQNIGNQTLSGSVGAVSGAGIFEDPSASTCTAFSLVPGATCVESFYANTQSLGSISASAPVSDNSLNGNPATQSLALSALSIGPAVTVSVSGPGSGAGSVISYPTSINCNLSAGSASGTCTSQYSTGLQLSFTAFPSSGSSFTGWGGACSGQTGTTCTVSITAATNVTATFTLVAPPSNTLNVTLQGSGSGVVTSADNLINCGETNGAANPNNVCTASYTGSESLTATAAPGSVFVGWTSGCGGSAPYCGVTGNVTATAVFAKQSFGNVYVCPKNAATSLSPCSATITVPFILLNSTTLGAIQTVTQGASGLDFAPGANNTCTGAVIAGASCSVDVTFTPIAPGLRAGAVTLFDNNGNPVATQAIYGVGQAPLAAFGPATVAVVNTTPNYALNVPNGVAVNSAGDLYIADAGNHRVVKVGANGTVSTVGSGLAYPQGMAVDGAGNLFIADNNLNAVVEVTPASVQTQMDFGLTSQLGVAVNGAGDLFVSSFNGGVVVKAPAGCTSAACTTAVYTAASGLHPVGLATDAAGDLFVTSVSYPPGQIPGQVVKVPPGCTNSSCQVQVGSGWSAPEAVAIDAAGDVFVADEAAPKIVEVPAGCNDASCQIALSSALAYGIAVDTKGDVIIPDRGSSDPYNNQVFVLASSQPPTALSFAITNSGSTSTDSPKAVTLQNVGNQPLAGTLALSGLGANFSGSGTCNSFTLAPGAACSEGFSFTPQTTGYFTGTASFSDNTLNLSPAVVLQQVSMTGIGGVNGVATTTAVPNVIGLPQAGAGTALTNSGLATGSISTASSSVVPAGNVIASNPAAGTQVPLNSAVKLQVSSGPGQAPAPNPLSLMNNFFVTGDYASAGVSLRGAAPVNGRVSGTINIAAGTGTGAVPTGADLIDGFLYWMTVENSAAPSGANATFLGYAISGQQIGKDVQNYSDGTASGTLRVYRADVNTYFQNGANGIRVGSGPFAISLPGAGTNGVVATEGASLVVLYRVLSPNFPLKAVVIYDGAAVPASATTQNMQGFYDASGGLTGNITSLFVDSNGWNNSGVSAFFNADDSQYAAPLNANAAYGALILSTPVNNPDNDAILAAWKNGPAASDFHGGEPGYYDVKTGLWVALPGAKPGQKDLFVQLDYMCGSILSNGSCDPSQENLFPSPDASGNDPLLMVQQAFAKSGIVLHLQIGNAIAEDNCTTDLPGQPCQFLNQPGVVGWKNSLEFSKVWPRNFASCATGGDCSPRFAYGQKDSYHYVLFGHSLAIPAWNTRYGSLVSISAVAGGQTTITTTDRGTGINKCPSRITIAGIQGQPNLNGVYTATSCPDTSTIVVATPSSVTTSWSYPNSTLAEPVIGITSGTVTSISGYSDLGGADSAVTLGLWETSGQDMSKRANVIAGTLFHELGHTIGLGHGGLYYDQGNYVPTFEANCKPNYQSIMNYLFQLDGVGPSSAIAFSNQALNTLTQSSLGSVTQLLGPGNVAATFPTSTWYVPTAPSSTASAATLHCDGTPLGGDVGYRVTGSIAPITPPWANGQNITFDGQPYTTLRGFNDLANIDLRQVGATGGQFASLASVLAFGSSYTPLNIAPGGSVAVGPGGTVTLGAGGTITLGGGGSVTVPSGGSISGNGAITFGTGGTITLGAGGTIAAGTDGVIGVPGGGNVTLGGGGTITLGAGGTVTLGGGGTVTLGAGGTITLGGGGATITIPAGGSYTLPAGGGTITPAAGGTVTLGGGGNVTLGGGGTITLGAGGTVTLGGGGNVTLGAGGTVTLGGGGNVTLGGGGTVTLGAGGTVTLGAGGNVTLGGGGNVTLGGGGTVTLGAGGDIAVGSGGNVTLGAGGTVTLGAGGNITLGAGGTVTLGGGGNVTLGGGGTITLGGGGTITMNAAGNVTLGAGGTITLGAGGTTVTIPPGGSYTVPAGGTITLGGGGNVTLGAGGNVTLGAGGTVTLGAGGNITLGGGGTVTLGGGGNVTLGAGGNVTLGAGGNVTLGVGGNITLGGGGNVTLGGGGASTTELDYDAANSIVRPPPAATYTVEGAAVQVSWTAPAFGVVQTYTISRSVNGGPAVVIGSVSGVNGSAPATTFTDTDPPTSGTVVYTIATTLVPDPGTGTQRQSPPSPPAVLTIDQTIQLGPLPSSVSISTPTLGVTATALSNGSPNNQLVSFVATGPCSTGTSTLTSGVSSATVTLTGTGACTITASQAGNSTAIPVVQPAYNAADPVSGTFTILPAGSNLQSQTITFPQLPNVQYGSAPVPVSATTTSNLPITFSTSSPQQCSVSGSSITIAGAGTCIVTASQAGNSTYTSASVTQHFNIAPAPLMVAAGNITVPYGQPIPSLVNDYTITGFVNGETSAVLNNTAPLISTTATSSSAPGTYPITVSTGTLAATNYSFVYVPGTLTVQSNPVISVTPSSLDFGTVYVGSVSIQSITVKNTGTAAATISNPIVALLKAGDRTEYAAVNLCPPSLAPGKSCVIAIGFYAGPYYNGPQTATLNIMDNAPGSPQPVALTATVINPQLSFNPASLSFGTILHGKTRSLTVTLSNPGATPLVFSGSGISIKGANYSSFAQSNNCGSSLPAGGKCAVSVTFKPAIARSFSANLTVEDNAQAGGGTQSIPITGKAN